MKQLEIKTREYQVGPTSICVAHLGERIELTLMTQLENGSSYNTFTLYFLPHQFKKLSAQWLDMLEETS